MQHRFLSYKLAVYLFALSIFATSSLPAVSLADDGKENLIKAAFIMNFVKFIEWPDGTSTSKPSKIDVCVIGDSGLVKTSHIFSQTAGNNLKLSVVSEQNIGNISSHCHILFVSESEDSRLSSILSAIKGAPVLTIGDADNFIERGGMIGFAKDESKIRLEINRRATENAGIKIDSQLLEIALRVIDK